jgi:tRNA pseudouridine32 synthase/23S rRNA pseudouridine746 synthase
VHRGPNGGESLEDHFDACASGCRARRRSRTGSTATLRAAWCSAVIARRWRNSGKLFKNGAIAKTYWAVVEGAPVADEGVIELPLGRLDVRRGWWMKHDPKGQPAVTGGR